ncbi:hypothetical protein [Ruminococcus flavefaciens]|uniref:hypothetical protein n=1 Tax=Ruminococcus flavefaciens TaxID=1265 RepID=UPI00048BF792|nr:hypothetical protein [Ruminococcus flavefaciens]
MIGIVGAAEVQTVVYGLFLARCMDKTQLSFNVKEAIACIPNTSPFLKRLMEECLSESSKHYKKIIAAVPSLFQSPLLLI